LRRFGDALAEQLRLLAEGNERRLGEVKAVVETRLATLQEGNEKKLDQMRATVDEKLHATLEQRLRQREALVDLGHRAVERGVEAGYLRYLRECLRQRGGML
jgi:DNA recombination protein RmuC